MKIKIEDVISLYENKEGNPLLDVNGDLSEAAKATIESLKEALFLQKVNDFNKEFN